MSETQETGGLPPAAPAGSGGDINRDDLRAMLETERRQREQLERERDQERTNRVAAERRLEEVQGTVASAAETRFQLEVTTVAQQLAAKEADAEKAEREAAEAYEAGDIQKALKIQRQMAAAEASAQQLRERKAWLEGNKAQIIARSAPPPAQRQQAPDQGVAIDLSAYTSKQRAFLDKHPELEFATNPKSRARLAALHYEAEAEGIATDSAEYFEFLEEGLGRQRGGQQQQTEEPPPRQAEPQARRTRDTGNDLPVQRRSPATAGGTRREGTVSLSAEEREIADMTMPDVPAQDYRDADGTVQPGRYRRYHLQRQRLKETGRI